MGAHEGGDPWAHNNRRSLACQCFDPPPGEGAPEQRVCVFTNLLMYKGATYYVSEGARGRAATVLLFGGLKGQRVGAQATRL